MKLFKYGLPFAALALLASCANDNIGEPTPEGVGNEDGYNAKFTVTLPSVSGSRAVSFEDYNEVNASEYAIRNAGIYIYQDKSDDAATTPGNENDYELIAASQLFYNPTVNNASTDVSNTVTIQVKLSSLDKEATTYYALCIVNQDDQGDDGAPGNGFVLPTVGEKFGVWKEKIMGSKTSGNPFLSTYKGVNYFTMTNAPTFTRDNGDETTPLTSLPNITTLVPVEASAFVASPQTPSASAANFYVQRGVAKVILQGKKGNTNVDLAAIPCKDREDIFNATDWYLDVTNYVTYGVQNVSNVNTEMGKLTGSKTHFYTEKSGSSVEFNHIWWAKDPNYGATSGQLETDFFYLNDNPTTTLNAVRGENAKLTDYCLENLMPFGSMKQNETTRIVVKGVYKVKDNTNEDYSFVVNPNTDEAYPIDSHLLNASAKESKTGVALNTLFDTTQDGASAAIKEIADALHMNPTGTDKVDFYYQGVTYYVARINHFDPTNTDEAGLAANQKITNDAENFGYTAQQTGRYSVLRNNAYYISVEQVLGYGSPTVPPPGTTPDDEPETNKYNIKVDINVLKWAVRDYGYTLQ